MRVCGCVPCALLNSVFSPNPFSPWPGHGALYCIFICDAIIIILYIIVLLAAVQAWDRHGISMEQVPSPATWSWSVVRSVTAGEGLSSNLMQVRQVLCALCEMYAHARALCACGGGKRGISEVVATPANTYTPIVPSPHFPVAPSRHPLRPAGEGRREARGSVGGGYHSQWKPRRRIPKKNM
jgi:hypothetical protein